MVGELMLSNGRLSCGVTGPDGDIHLAPRGS